MRSFLAVDIDSRVKSEINRFLEKLRRVQESVKWVQQDNVHITLYFFGEIDDPTLQALEGVVQSAVLGLSSFSVGIEGLSAFPSTSRPRVIWLGVRDATGTLKRIYSAVYEQIMACNLDVEREKKGYTPHITVGRVKERTAPKLIDELGTSRGIYFGDIAVNSVVLYKSTLTRTGPIYEPLRVFPFGTQS